MGLILNYPLLFCLLESNLEDHLYLSGSGLLSSITEHSSGSSTVASGVTTGGPNPVGGPSPHGDSQYVAAGAAAGGGDGTSAGNSSSGTRENPVIVSDKPGGLFVNGSIDSYEMRLERTRIANALNPHVARDRNWRTLGDLGVSQADMDIIGRVLETRPEFDHYIH